MKITPWLRTLSSGQQTTQGDDGDDVRLFLHGCVVGRGIVHHVNPTQCCHNVLIGIENVSVRILVVNEGHEEDLLPFPHIGAKTLKEAIGTQVK